ncbi:Uma2 family endonuclease [Nonomuraea sp. B19D2]|uniref:Uma2 family endonuclease n=1 Tax=Nonomuraea sp. B19D2 TaxID=3159561 RepID=UPI0032DA3E5E
MMEEKHQTESTYAKLTRTGMTARELFDALPPIPDLRVEVIEGKMLVSPMGSPEHGWMATRLHNALLPLLTQRGWEAAMGLNLCVEGPRDSPAPDYVVAPSDCPRWGKWELLASGVVMVAEVVSPSSVYTDRVEKRRTYALGRVPIYVLIDPIADEPSVTVFSEIKDDAYEVAITEQIGAPIMLPAPIDFELDTSIFKM